MVKGLEQITLDRLDECCGFGGTFSIKNADTSSAILDDKLQAVVDTGADVVTAVDMSCLAQIGGGLSKRQIDVHALHIAEILAATT